MPRFGEILNSERKKDFQEVVKYYQSFKIADIFFEKENLTLLNGIHKLASGLNMLSLIKNVPEYARPYLLQLKSDAVQLISCAMVGTERGLKLLERSLIENVFRYIYYYHHQIEHNLLQTEPGSYKTFKELCEYSKKHPFFKDNSTIGDSIAILHSKYSELSKTIHTATIGEMSVVEGIISLHKPLSNVNKEIDNFGTIAQNIMYLLVCFHSKDLTSFSFDELRVVTLLLSTPQKKKSCQLT
jgi:hypothetical protein